MKKLFLICTLIILALLVTFLLRGRAPIKTPIIEVLKGPKALDCRGKMPCPKGCYQGPSWCAGSGSGSVCSDDEHCDEPGYNPIISTPPDSTKMAYSPSDFIPDSPPPARRSHARHGGQGKSAGTPESPDNRARFNPFFRLKKIPPETAHQPVST